MVEREVNLWMHLLAQADSLTLPGYGLAGIVIAGLSTALLKLYNRNTELTDQAIRRERQTADETIPLLVKAIDVLSQAAPHIDRAGSQVQGEADLAQMVRRMESMLGDLAKREGRTDTR